MAIILISGFFILLSMFLCVGGFCMVQRNTNSDGKTLRDSKKMYLAAGYLFLRFKRKAIKSMQVQQQEEQFYRIIYVNDNPGKQRLYRECTQGLIVFSLMFLFGIVVLCMALTGCFDDRRVASFVRPVSGTDVYQLKARINQKDYDTEFRVNERTLTEQEVVEAWEKAKISLPKQMLGTNRCAEEVTKNLFFPTKLDGTNVELIWMSSDYKLVDYDGNVYSRNASAEGSMVTITIEVKYGQFVSFLEVPIRVIRENGGEEDTGERLTEELMRKDAEQAYEEIMELPTEVGESPVVFYKKKSKSPWLFAVLFLLSVIGLLALWESEDKRLRKEREDQLLRDYPDLVSKITLLLQAGLTLRSAWDRITEDYESSKKSAHKKETRYVYEEMRSIRNRLNAGVPEENAYEEFGKNCGNIRYLRLSSLLVQNLKKGTGGLIPLLRKEAAEAFADRKERVKQKGEEAGTKLLIPMAGILVLILAIIMIPAFLSF